MSSNPSKNFSEVFAEVLNQREADPIEHILVLTYEFDEQQLVNLCVGRTLEDEFELRQLHLKILSDIRPLVIYDSRKTKAFSKLPQFIELHPFRSSAFACHHSKAYLVITRHAVHLCLGSFNLTHTGLFRNREVMECYCWDNDSKANAHILTEWISFLEVAYGNLLKESSYSAMQTILNKLKHRLLSFTSTTDTNSSRIIHSGYGVRGIDALRTYWEKCFPNSEPVECFVVSPFFDEDPERKAFTIELKKSFSKLDSLELVTDECVLKNIGQAHWSGLKGALRVIPTDMDESERKEVLALSRKGNESLSLTRKLHAKILMLSNGKQSIVYMGSANFTCKAWLDQNQELGVAFVEENPQLFRTIAMQCLHVDVQKNWINTIPVNAPNENLTEDEEGYTDQTGYPEEIFGILLQADEPCQKVRFHFETQQSEYLDNYRITWAGLRLTVENQFSQWISGDEFRIRLLGGRNLAFYPKALIDKCYYLPFQYAGSLVDVREAMIHPTSLDWLNFYLNPDQNLFCNEGEAMPGENNGSDDHSDYSVFIDRSENPVIAMQSYLNSFTRIERDFLSKASDIQKYLEPESQRETLKNQVIQPMLSLCRLLMNETQTQGTDSLFKLGELQIFLVRLQNSLQPTMNDLVQQVHSLCQQAIQASSANEPIAKAYCSFIKSFGETIHA